MLSPIPSVRTTKSRCFARHRASFPDSGIFLRSSSHRVSNKSETFMSAIIFPPALTFLECRDTSLLFSLSPSSFQGDFCFHNSLKLVPFFFEHLKSSFSLLDLPLFFSDIFCSWGLSLALQPLACPVGSVNSVNCKSAKSKHFFFF